MNTILKDDDIKEMAVRIMKNSPWKKKLSLTEQLEQTKYLYNETSKHAAECRVMLTQKDNEIKELKNDKRWLQQLLQEMSSIQFMKIKNM